MVIDTRQLQHSELTRRHIPGVSKAYLLHFVRRSIGFFEARKLATGVEVNLPYRLRCLYVSQREFFGVASAEASGGVDTHGRERGRCCICRGNDSSLGGGRERELPHGCIRIHDLGVHRC
jgi:hypothetical protein